MRVLILTCNTGGGHNAVAAALRDSLQRCGASCDVMDGLGFISKKASKFVSKWHTRFYRRYPRLYKAGYMSAEGDKEMDRRDGPVYRYIARGARRLERLSGVLLRGHGLHLQPHGGCLYPGYLRHSPSGAGRRVRQLRHRPRYPSARRHSRAFRLPRAWR